ncbi:MAG TPA: glycosyltransferase family 39 protein, partial [Anaerolineae bacterium]|nr:glycosyltransferase family 39 protein [Anaerolineae bacterium]
MRTDRSSVAARASWPWFQDYLLPALVTLLAMALYLNGLDSKSLWYDELGTLSNIGWNDGWLAAIRNPLVIPIVPKPPLFFLVSRLLFEVSDSVFVLRLPSVFFATMTIPLVYALGRSFFERQFGLIGALLLAIAPLFIRYAQEARMYAMLVFLSMLSLYLFWQAVRSDRWGWWLAFIVATAASLYTHQFALLPLGVMTLFTLWLLIRPRTRSRFLFRGWHFFVALAAILLLLVPVAPFLVDGLKSGRGLGGSAAPRWSLAHMAGALRLFSGGSDAGAVIYAALFLLAVVVLAIKQRDLLALSVMWIGVPFAILLVVPFGH